MSASAGEQLHEAIELCERLDINMKFMPEDTPPDKFLAMWLNAQKMMVQRLSQTFGEDEFDPAFAYALEHINFCPKYWAKSVPKKERLKRMTEWNDFIDEYISLGINSRNNKSIEKCAKIGPDGAGLYKRCGFCGILETEVASFEVCSKCKLQTCCSKKCQSLAWKEGGHKDKCGKENYTDDCLLHLPSQETCIFYFEVMQQNLNKDLKARLESNETNNPQRPVDLD